MKRLRGVRMPNGTLYPIDVANRDYHHLSQIATLLLATGFVTLALSLQFRFRGQRAVNYGENRKSYAVRNAWRK
jgi:hypothetical protein